MHRISYLSGTKGAASGHHAWFPHNVRGRHVETNWVARKGCGDAAKLGVSWWSPQRGKSRIGYWHDPWQMQVCDPSQTGSLSSMRAHSLLNCKGILQPKWRRIVSLNGSTSTLRDKPIRSTRSGSSTHWHPSFSWYPSALIYTVKLFSVAWSPPWHLYMLLRWQIVWHSIWHIFWHSTWHTIWHTLWLSTWHIFWHIFWHPMWHSIWQIFWHSIWQIFWHFIWHTFWHSIWQSIWHNRLTF